MKIAIAGVEYASNILGLQDILVEFRSKSFFKKSDIIGMFMKDSFTIIFNEDWINDANEFEILKCSFHETRHAYQRACIEFPEIMKCELDSIEQWKAEFDNYLSPGQHTYETQAIEIDYQVQ